MVINDITAKECVLYFKPVIFSLYNRINTEEIELKDIISYIKFDPVIALWIFKWCKEIVFDYDISVLSFKNAVNLIGMERLEFGVSILNYFIDTRKELLNDNVRFNHRHSVLTALIAAKISYHINKYIPVKPENVYACALLHDIGKFASDNQILKKRSVIEKGLFIADKFFLPELIKKVIKYHYSPFYSGDIDYYCAIVYVADYLAEKIRDKEYYKLDFNDNDFDRRVFDKLYIPVERYKLIADEVSRYEIIKYDNIIS